MTREELIVIVAYYVILFVLTIYAAHRLHLIRLLRSSSRSKPEGRTPNNWPAVCVQLPVFNEPLVAERLVRAAAAIDYPGRLRVQVLDDSTDETTAIISHTIASIAASLDDSIPGSIHIEHIRRDQRTGYKAGALSRGLELCDEDYIAVFDADFLPQTDFLTLTIPHFAPNIGMVQCRWDHINRNESLLTRLQALYLDAHFGVESPARYRSGAFFNFNGTAGVWRREAIEQGGGWSAATVTEDLDLSYRVQKAGWRFVFLDDVAVPAELPSTLGAFHGQQHRWAKGSIQTARRQLWSILRSDLQRGVRVEAAFHLTNNSAYLLTLLLALLLVPSIIIRYSLGLSALFLLDIVLFSTCTGSLIQFYREGQRRVGRKPPPLWELVATVPFGVGLCVVNASAVLEGIWSRAGIFNRTPKSGGKGRLRTEAPPRLPLTEAVVTVWLLISLVVLARAGLFAASPFLVLFLLGFGSTTLLAGRERLHWFRDRNKANLS